MYYDRQIKYFDYKKGGVKRKSAGYLKIEIRDESCKLFLQIAGVPSAENGTGQVIGLWEDREEILGNISLQDGRGNKELGFIRRHGPLDKGENRKGNSDSPMYEGLQGIRILLGVDEELFCKIGNGEDSERQDFSQTRSKTPDEERKAYNEPLVLEEVSKASDGVMSGAEELYVADETEPVVTIVSEKQERAEIVAEEEISEEKMPEEMMQEENPADREPPPPTTSGSRRMLEEKWEQLWAVYPHRRPFRDEREYLQIGPEDFVIFRERFYKLVHNSFLLHGFYNYQHLIMTRLERRGESFYYIGVPGNFYEREKQVAVMYGFESFECAEEPAGQGDFGYYMIRVEL